jgi:hypothetical protein
MKVIIAGSRGINPDLGQVVTCVALSGYDVTELVCGGAAGVDRAGRHWADHFKIPVKLFMPDWNTHSKSAGMIRNKQMGDYADALVAIWDCESRGTAHMIRHMQQLEKPYYVFTIDGGQIRWINSSLANNK